MTPTSVTCRRMCTFGRDLFMVYIHVYMRRVVLMTAYYGMRPSLDTETSRGFFSSLLLFCTVHKNMNHSRCWSGNSTAALHMFMCCIFRCMQNLHVPCMKSHQFKMPQLTCAQTHFRPRVGHGPNMGDQHSFTELAYSVSNQQLPHSRSLLLPLVSRWSTASISTVYRYTSVC